MKILIVPMAAVAQTEGPFSRAVLLANAFLKKGITVALCAAENKNPPPNIPNYPISTPTPMGLPKWLGLRVYPLADKLGVIGRKPVFSFEEVLHLTGASSYAYLKLSIDEIRSTIRRFEPDVVYSEFNLSAILAAKAENKPILASYSFPTQTSYAASPQYAKGFNRILKELGQPPVYSALDLFTRTDKWIIPSSPLLEPISNDKCLFVGPFKALPATPVLEQRNCILVYMGNGTISNKKLRQVVFEAFGSTSYQVYVAGMPDYEEYQNIHMAPRFNFLELFSKTAVYINHGGQNSIMDGFLFGIPQLICAGKVFERNYNAKSVEKNNAGISIALSDFQPSILSRTVDHLVCDNTFRNNAAALGHTLSALGGADAVADYIVTHFK